MPEMPLTWISLLIVAVGTIFIGRWVKKEYLYQALIALAFVALTLILIQI